VVIARRRFDPDQAADGVSYRGRTHTIDLRKPIYREKGKFYYLIEMESGQISVGEGKEPPVSPKLMDSIMRKEVAKQLVMGLEPTGDLKSMLLVIVVVAVAGILGGFILGQLFHLGVAPAVNGTASEIVMLLGG
jgi:hypothetical protein